MKLRGVFLLCFVAACLPAVAWSGWAAWRAQAAWLRASEAVRSAGAMGTALRLADALSLERGAMQERMLSAGPTADNLPEMSAVTDGLFVQTLDCLRLAGIPDTAIVQAQEMLREGRELLSTTIRQPLAERDLSTLPPFMKQMYARLADVQSAARLAQIKAARADPHIGAFVAAGSVAMELRILAGRRSSTLSAWLAGLTLTPGQLADEIMLTGKIEQAWEQFQRQTEIVGAPPRLAAAIEAVRTGYFSAAEPRYRALVAIAQAGGRRPMPLVEYRRWTIEQLTSLRAVQDLAIQKGITYGQALQRRARVELLLAAAEMLAMLVLGVGAFAVLLNRLVLPVQELTIAVTRLADGDTTTPVPACDHRDEIGAVAAAIEVFRRTAVALRQTNLRFDAALRNMQHGLTMYDADDRLVVVNDRACENRNVPLGSLKVGMHFHEVISVLIAAGNFQHRTLEEVLAERRGIDAVTGRVNAFEEMNGGRALFTLSNPMPDGGWISTSEDITARKQAETALREANDHLEQRVAEAVARHAQTEEALRQSQKMEAVGQLTGGIAHDFNNMLASVSASLEVMQIRIDQGRTGQLERYITMAQGATRRAAALTHRLLAFSRRQTLDPQPIDVNRLVAGMEELICRTVGPAIRVEVIGGDALWPTLIDANQLDNALLNLCINARDAMPGGGRLVIETMNCRLDASAIVEQDLLPGEYMALRVSDTGAGMPPEVIARAFDPFFTTKPIGQGTGLGLSMIYGFVRQSGGQVIIRSVPGQGTQVSLHLPRYQPPDSVPVLSEAGAAPPLPGRTVLLVDDEPMLRTLMAEALEESGYAAIACSDGPTGLKVLESGRRIDLLITDVGLPGGMNGRQLADAARLTRADLRVLFMTGYAESAGLANGHLDAGMEVLAKPFAIELLTKRVDALISAP